MDVIESLEIWWELNTPRVTHAGHGTGVRVGARCVQPGSTRLDGAGAMPRPARSVS